MTAEGRTEWVLVPKEPTMFMRQAALDESRVTMVANQHPLPEGYELWASAIVYRAMIAAAPPVAQPSQTAPIAWFKHTGDPNIDTAVDMCWGKTPPKEGTMWNPLFATPVAQAEPVGHFVNAAPDDEPPSYMQITDEYVGNSAGIPLYASPHDPLTLIRATLEAAAARIEGQNWGMIGELAASWCRKTDPTEILAGVAQMLQALFIRNAELENDAARYRFLRAQYWNESSLFVVAGSKAPVRLGTDCPNHERLDEAIDAAITASVGGPGPIADGG